MFILEDIFGWSFFCCFMFFTWNSQVCSFLKQWIEKQAKLIQVKNKKGAIKWCSYKFVFLINCVFCLSFWFFMILEFANFGDPYYIKMAVTVPWVSLIFWGLWMFLKGVSAPSNKVINKLTKKNEAVS